ncbi:MAG TPA: ABC transporter substrate-binding protein [Methanocorpusculum sp.]|nr:ABC transporter substrate-binding protein [Methanocorpusculum sp.]
MQKKSLLVLLGILVLFAAIISAGCTSTDPEHPIVEIVEITSAQQINSLALGQIDGMINWQPNVAATELAGIGTVISYSQDLPRPDNKTWEDHTCCVFGCNEDGLENTDMATVLTGLMLLGNAYVNEYPNESAESVSNWMYGTTDPTFGTETLEGIDIITKSLPTINFKTDITEKWLDSNYEFIEIQRDLNIIMDNLASLPRNETEELIYDFGPYAAAKKIIDENGKFPEPVSETIKIGYLLSDHDAPLFVLLKNWEYFANKYNTYLKPTKEKDGAISKAELYVNGKKICDVELIQGSGGQNLMTVMQTNEIQYAIAGSSPYFTSIDIQPDLKILSPIMTEGSALMVDINAPATTWDEFVQWALQRNAEGNPLLIATPQFNSIQDVQLRYALESAGITYQKKR